MGWSLLAILVTIVSSYFIYMPAQKEVEYRFASYISQRIDRFPLEFPNAQLTNFAQLLSDSREDYPYAWHEWFRVYGEQAGFKYSLAEKFVISPPGVIHRDEIHFISAQTFPVHGYPHRIVFYGRTNNHGFDLLFERSITSVFQEAGKTIPTAPASQPPSPAPQATSRNSAHYYLSSWLPFRGQFSQLEWKGVAPQTARKLEKLCCWGLAILSVAFIGYCLWPVPAPMLEESIVRPPTTSSQKIWTVVGATLGLFLLSGVWLPTVGSDRGYGQLFAHLVFPYSAACESMAGLLLLAEVIIYDTVLCFAWIRNRLRLATMIMVAVHLFAIAFSIFVLRTGR